ncbi:hypothetical protein ACWEOW_01260 [Monashia sp. NPDC004114]
MQGPGSAFAPSAAVDMGGQVPVQYFQSVIAVELAVAGALLFQVHYFDRDRDANPKSDPWTLLFMAMVIAATLFGCLEAMREGWGSLAAVLVTVGLAVSVLPILLRVLPPITRDLETQQHDPHRWVTVVTLALYVAVVTVIVLIR